jgi:coenzyme F420-reducing hydrogenase beta subunit
MTSEVSYRELSAFCWNVLGVDPDDVMTIAMAEGRIVVETVLRDGARNLVPFNSEEVAVTRHEARVTHDG